jgi:hypothetical protein
VVKVGTANGPKVLKNGGAILIHCYKFFMKRITFISLLMLASFLLKAQKHVDHELFNTIYKQDSAWFDAFNTKNLPEFKKYVDSSLEFYHDNSGLTNYTQNINAFTSIFKNVPDLKRSLIKETMEVYPIPNYGAVQIAQHRFCHLENGKMDCGVFKFIHVWKQTQTGWKVTRIISVDH